MDFKCLDEAIFRKKILIRLVGLNIEFKVEMFTHTYKINNFHRSTVYSK